MVIVVIGDKPSREDIKRAREEYTEYIKITADIEQEIVAIGGEYHADAEQILAEKYGSLNANVWGGGYTITQDRFEVNALLNIKPGKNESADILDPQVRNWFLETVRAKLGEIKSLI